MREGHVLFLSPGRGIRDETPQPPLIDVLLTLLVIFMIIAPVPPLANEPSSRSLRPNISSHR